MTLPKVLLDFLNRKAKEAYVEQPKADDDFFKMGILDSFTLVDLIIVLEEECGIKVPDADVIAANFQSINAIERYIESQKG